MDKMDWEANSLRVRKRRSAQSHRMQAIVCIRTALGTHGLGIQMRTAADRNAAPHSRPVTGIYHAGRAVFTGVGSIAEKKRIKPVAPRMTWKADIHVSMEGLRDVNGGLPQLAAGCNQANRGRPPTAFQHGLEYGVPVLHVIRFLMAPRSSKKMLSPQGTPAGAISNDYITAARRAVR